ncbi:hypothetical protein [Actinoplanes sp. N902-109]|uniref:hypothetical protein n=1 Tax=Actinoplanes sp. (strain N902-109) TaxID=649831 RepID=UPI00032949AC|nr:hypothetical protein [Actinoplanes sp. N902-109]AGL20938.1 hypothetical protein L083_7428 [Actinoplanes sp. N902-109]
MSSPRRRQNPPPVRCSAKAKRTGEQCERWAVPGRLQCKHHGAYAGPHEGRQAAEERAGATLTLAEMMASNPGRPVWEVILDSIRTVDVLATHAVQEVAAGKVTSAEGIERVAGLARSAHAMAASAVATKALDLATQSANRWGDLVSDRLAVLLVDWFGLPTGRAVTEAVTAVLGSIDLNEPGTPPRPDGPPLLALVSHALAAALAPRLGLSAGDVTAWVARVADAVADGRPAPALPGAPVAALPPAPVAEPEVKPAPPAADPEPVLTLHSQAGSGDEAEEIEVVEAELVEVEAELVESEPEPRRHHTTTLGLGSRRAEPAFQSSYRTF